MVAAFGGGRWKQEKVHQTRWLMQAQRGRGEVRGGWDSVAEFTLFRLKLNCCVYCHFVLGLRAVFLCINVNRIKRNRMEISPVFVLAVWLLLVGFLV